MRRYTAKWFLILLFAGSLFGIGLSSMLAYTGVGLSLPTGQTGADTPLKDTTIPAHDVLSIMTAETQADGDEDPKTAISQNAEVVLPAVACPAISVRNFSASSYAGLRKLADYEQVCPGVISGASFFIETPTTTSSATADAHWIASVLRAFEQAHIQPIIFMEPMQAGAKLNATTYRSGSYDAALDTLFSTLKSLGIKDSTMGTWVPWPEANIPVWSSVSPSDFAANVTKTVQLQKKHFPGSKAAVLLDSKTYPSTKSWENGTYKSLVPFVDTIPKGLINSFGLQGFAWPPTSPGDSAQLDAATFLPLSMADEAARTLGVSEVWLNTGVFASSSIISRTNPYTLSPVVRLRVFNGILSQARGLRSRGYKVAVHLFAEDKSAPEEGINWSFWTAGKMNESQHTPVYRRFVHDVRAIGAELWLFDTAD